jgi:hypothetical protein
MGSESDLESAHTVTLQSLTALNLSHKLNGQEERVSKEVITGRFLRY